MTYDLTSELQEGELNMETVRFYLSFHKAYSAKLVVMELVASADQAAVVDRLRLMVEDYMAGKGYVCSELKGRISGKKEKEE